MKPLKQYKFWFVVGSQHLYGEEALLQVRNNAEIVAKGLDASENIPAEVIFKGVATTPEEIADICRGANYDTDCAGVITWCHTFSPSKMWIAGLSILQKPWLQLHTQFNMQIPADTIDMDFMNLNQAAHGDREHGFIGTRLSKNRKVVVGYWEDEDVARKIGGWMRSAAGAAASRKLKLIRFGDNMRQVAVTEGDKVEAEIALGWSVNTYGVGDLAEYVNQVSKADIDAKMQEYKDKYDIDTDMLQAVEYQGKMEIGIERLLQDRGAFAFTTNFEDLHGLEQLPGLAAQNLMAKGYGFGGEGDWKVSALTYIMKKMAVGKGLGTSFMEDYTYDFTKGSERILGAHMLEICPSISADRPKIKVHPLGIGGKADPARLVFDGKEGPAIVVSLVDMGGRMRMIVNDIECSKPMLMPKLPVARAMWKPMPDLQTSAQAWILAGGAHHSVLSYDLDAEHMRDFAEIMDIEFVHIHKGTCINQLKQELFFADLVWKLK